MENQGIIIESATTDFAEELLALYAWYVEHTAITFEYTVPSIDEFRSRIKRTLEKYPWIVAREGNEILGYAYAGSFHDREAYDWAVETSIYVKHGMSGQGVGRILHDSLELLLKKQGILNMNACIAYPSVEDEYLTRNSVEFHAHMGYRNVGEFYQCGYKFGRWYNMVWMEKHIGEHIKGQPAVIPFPEIAF